MNISYFYRHPQCGYSIQRVFQTLVKEIAKQAEVGEVFMPAKESMPWDMIKNCLYAFKHRNKKGINHITGHIHDIIPALFGQKTVLTIHDLVFLDNVRNPIKRFYKWLFLLYIPVKLADKITCVSEQTKNNVLKHIATHKLSVIYNPVDPKFEYVPRSFNEEKPVILHIGTGWNKNLRRTIEALENIPCHLRIIGKLSNQDISLLNRKNIDYSNVCNLTDDEIRQEYINCDIVNFPSEYEGFGMPVIEGQKTGRMVIASYIEPLIDVSGGAVQFVNPHKTSSIHDAYLHVINDREYREVAIQAGLQNIERFSVQTIANQYLELYQQVLTHK
ncbi:glycosyl transferase family 1 [Bacteroidia bacterium]|nr:glycosyl transferase family 1 [Bacteroidia bacterium]